MRSSIRVLVLLWGFWSITVAVPAAGWAAEMAQSIEGFRFKETIRGRTTFSIEAQRAQKGSYQWKFFRLGWKPVFYLENAVVTRYDVRGRKLPAEKMALAMFDPAAKVLYDSDGTTIELKKPLRLPASSRLRRDFPWMGR